MAHPSTLPGLSYCAEQVRAHDPDRYLCTLFAPAEAREALFALYAFDHEIARVRHVVSDPMPGLIRLQWWRDALDRIAAGRPLAHPVVEDLHRNWPQLAGQRERLEAAIDAREAELEEEAPFAEPAAFERHVEATTGGIMRAALAVLGAEDERTLEAGREIALAWGVAALLRSVPEDAGQRRLLLPLSIADDAGVDRETVFAGSGDAALRRAIAGLLKAARGHLVRARRLRRRVARDALPVLLLGSLAGDYFRRLARARHDPFAAAPRQRSPLAPLALLWRRVRGTF